MHEDAEKLEVEVECPRMKREDLELQLVEENLIIKGKKTREEKKKGYYESEYGSFERWVPVPEVDPDKVTAEMKDGVLHIVLPKIGKERSKTRTLSIK